MRTGWRKHVSVLIAFLMFFIGTVGPAFPRIAAAQPCAMMMLASPDDAMPSGDDGGATKHSVCIDAAGCIVSAKLPDDPLLGWSFVEWTVVTYEHHDSVLTGRTVGPELDPPISA